MGNNTFSNISEEDLRLTKEAYRHMLSLMKVNRFCFTGKPAYQSQVDLYNEKIVRVNALINAVSVELSLREIKEDVQG
jgi:hypothetical protein